MREEDRIKILDILLEFHKKHMHWYDAFNPFWGFRLERFIVEELRKIPIENEDCNNSGRKRWLDLQDLCYINDQLHKRQRFN